MTNQPNPVGAARIESFCRHHPAQVERILDPEGKLAARFNARWTPRAYLLDGAGRVTYVQPDTTLDSEAIPEAARLLESGGA